MRVGEREVEKKKRRRKKEEKRREKKEKKKSHVRVCPGCKKSTVVT
jgi:hypothetical protein